MESLKSLPNILPFITLIGAAVPFIKVLVNAFTAHELDKLLKTPWKKFIETTVLILTSTFLVSMMIFTELEDVNLKSWSESTNELIGNFFILYLIVVAIIISMVYPLIELVKLFCYRSYYFIKDKENDERWIIEVPEDKGKFYLRNGDKNKIVSSLDNDVILRGKKQTDQAKKVYGWFEKYKFIKIIVIVSLIIGLDLIITTFIMYLVFGDILYFFRVAMFIFVELIIAIFLSGWNDYENLVENNNGTV